MFYKLTDSLGRTHDNTQWGPGVEHTAPGTGDLCGDGYLHAYTDPLLAEMLNSVHADFGAGRRLWEADGDVCRTDHGLKVGCTRLRTDREIPVPEITVVQRVRFAILCVREVYNEPGWTAWAERWLSGADRSRQAAWGAAEVETTAAGAWGAAAAAWAARAAAWVAVAAGACEAAEWAAVAAEWAAVAAAWAAWAGELDLIALAHQAVGEKAVTT